MTANFVDMRAKRHIAEFQFFERGTGRTFLQKSPPRKISQKIKLSFERQKVADVLVHKYVLIDMARTEYRVSAVFQPYLRHGIFKPLAPSR